MAEYFDDSVFKHIINVERSLYMLIRNTEIENGNINDDDIIEFIDSNFTE